MEDKLELLIESFGLENLLDCNDIRHERVLELVIEMGWVDLNDYFYEDVEDE